MNKKKLFEVVANFDINGVAIDFEECNGGHINKTYVVRFKMTNGEEKNYILQYINGMVFPNIEGIMENTKKITEHIKDKISTNGGDIARETVALVPLKSTLSILPLYDSNWRMEEFIEGSIAMTATNKLKLIYESGKIVGKFQNMLSDYNEPEKLCEIIKDFHNTPVRYKNFDKAVEESKVLRKGRYENAQCYQKENFNFIHYINERKHKCDIITSKLEDGTMPIRVTHNDTKLANVLFDKITLKALCLIDLDTLMPGSLLYDFGEGVRTSITTAEEDEQDIKKINISLERFEAYTKGFLEGVGDKITKEEIDMLFDGAYIMTYENGIRFVTDDLNGDIYYAVNSNIPHHNLVRARVQFEILSQMEKQKEKMQEIIRKYVTT